MQFTTLSKYKEGAILSNAEENNNVPVSLSVKRSVFDAYPFCSRFLAGTLFGVVVILCFLAMVAILIAMEKFDGNPSGGAGGIIGFIVLPIAALVGAPWSFMFWAHTFPFGIAAGILINGSIIGAVWGLVAMARKKQQRCCKTCP